jgi:hypothetical protein
MNAAPKRLSELIRDAIDGGEECRGRDSQLTQWIEMAESLEAVRRAAQALCDWRATGHGDGIQMRDLRAALTRITEGG